MRPPKPQGPSPSRRGAPALLNPEPGRGLDFMDRATRALRDAGSEKGVMGFPKQIRQFPMNPRYGDSMTAQDAFAERGIARAALSTPRAQQRIA